MRGADLVKLNEAAAYLGVSPRTLAEQVDSGRVPEAVRQHRDWALPMGELVTIAKRHGWMLDLTDRHRSPIPATVGVSHRPVDSLAAHAAVVLAKAQATAARSKATALEDRLRDAADDLDTTRSESESLAQALAEIRELNFQLETERTRAEGRAAEMREQLSYERSQRVVLAQRIRQLERERNQLRLAMGWRARRRLRQSR